MTTPRLILALKTSVYGTDCRAWRMPRKSVMIENNSSLAIELISTMLRAFP
jgi:hypothetical protein